MLRKTGAIADGYRKVEGKWRKRSMSTVIWNAHRRHDRFWYSDAAARRLLAIGALTDSDYTGSKTPEISGTTILPPKPVEGWNSANHDVAHSDDDQTPVLSSVAPLMADETAEHGRFCGAETSPQLQQNVIQLFP